MEKVRVRFAPSPTGYLHIGGARTALFNWLFARHVGGVLVLRIEDTDVERSTQEATQQILDSMKWLGLSWDEGPFYQSQRYDLYKRRAQELLESGAAYKCFCTKERLEAMREKAAREKKDFIYDGTCRNLTPDEVKAKESAGESYVLRFRIPAAGETVFRDAIAKDVRFENALLGDFVIMRADGHPTYNFCCVVDDADMKITHVVRAADHISNTPRQILIYQALREPIPQFVHVPLILGPDKSKLSKRHGAASVMEYAADGFLPEAVFNYLALLGWSPGNDEEILPKEQLISRFDLYGINHVNAVFDIAKLRWMNGMYLRAMPKEEAIQRVIEYMPSKGIHPAQYDAVWLAGIIALEIERAETLSELVAHLHYYFRDDFPYDEEGARKIAKKGSIADGLQMAREALSGVAEFSIEAMESAMRQYTEERNIGFGKIAQPVRLALTGGLASPGLFEVMHLLGKEKCMARIERAILFFKEKNL